ncbi:MAG TPA: caspase family protein [Pirellulaceae bacterium]|nr:caspase family protein [Pirellulaceae bacterium]HMO93921.1 caspase family protein [Pirellulaceae bacterium]HMP68959.1 caspase family protein [Pirellulaceae bacterium]
MNVQGNIFGKAMFSRFVNFGVLFFIWGVVNALTAQDRYAVLVGVGDYDPGRFEALAYAKADATELEKALARIGFNTTLITADARSPRLRPTNPEKILTAVQTVARSCSKGDTLIVSLSGHGVQFLEDQGDGKKMPETYFCPEDADLFDKSTLLKIHDLLTVLEKCQASRKLLLIDACRNDALVGEGRTKAARKLDLGSVHENNLTIPGGLTVLFSCDSGQFSWEHSDLGHSVFSHFVIEYFSGLGERRYYPNNKLTHDELISYVRKKTNQYVFEKNLSADGQYPVLQGKTTEWILGDLLAEIRMDSSIEGLQFAASRGSMEANYYLGRRYFEGEGVTQDYETALGYFKAAAEVGDADSQNYVGLCYHEGHGVTQNYAEALKWYRRAADNDNDVAKYNIGILYEYGLGIEQSYRRAKLWYNRAANAGFADAQFQLATLYHFGNIGEPDYEMAMKWYRLAAEQYHPSATNNIGVLYEHGNGVEQDFAEALVWFQRAAELGEPLGYRNIASQYYKGLGVDQDYHQALEWFLKAAEYEDDESQYTIGEFYYFGYGVEQDFARAMEWYKRAAEHEHAGAIFSIGHLYDYGKGVATDFQEAMKWYRLAADQDYSSAITAIGVLYRNGEGVSQDYRQAMDWFLRASKLEDGLAQYYIGMMIANGEGYKQDRAIATDWLKKAAGNGSSQAAQQLREWNVNF